jgi:hypothetical protein
VVPPLCRHRMVVKIILITCLPEGSDRIRHSARGGDNDLSSDLPPFARLFLHVDESKFEQFLRNVIANAVRIFPLSLFHGRVPW